MLTAKPQTVLVYCIILIQMMVILKYLNEKYKSNESEAILFNSNLLHKGIGDEKNLRYNLNILIRYESDT